MAIEFSSIMFHLLDRLKDGKTYSVKNLIEILGTELNLGEEDKEKIIGGRQTKFQNRVYWAKIHLSRAGLIVSPEKGFIKITEKGLELLNQNPEKIDFKLLRQMPGWNPTKKPYKDKIKELPKSYEITDRTPNELIEIGYKKIYDELSNELLEQVKNISPDFFEKLVIQLLLKMGYGGSREDAGRAIGKSGDEGIDGIINEDKLGLDVIYIQAKRWNDTIVGRPEIQKFVGALHGKQAKKGIFITTSSFSKEARNYAEMVDSKVVLIDGEYLSQLMINHNVGVSTIETYEIKKIDSDYFFEE